MCVKPLLFVDIDGVVSLFGFPSDGRPEGTWQNVDGIVHFLSAEAGRHLHSLRADYELVWCSGWEEKCNEYLPGALGLPRSLPFLTFGDPGSGERGHWKLAAVEAYARRPAAGLDRRRLQRGLPRMGRSPRRADPARRDAAPDRAHRRRGRAAVGVGALTREVIVALPGGGHAEGMTTTTAIGTRQLHDLVPLAGTLGIEAVATDPAAVALALPWEPGLCTAGGVMHGGALMTLADTAGAVCAFLNLPEGAKGTTTIESKTNLLAAVSAAASQRPPPRFTPAAGSSSSRRRSATTTTTWWRRRPRLRPCFGETSFLPRYWAAGMTFRLEGGPGSAACPPSLP